MIRINDSTFIIEPVDNNRAWDTLIKRGYDPSHYMYIQTGINNFREEHHDFKHRDSRQYLTV